LASQKKKSSKKSVSIPKHARVRTLTYQKPTLQLQKINISKSRHVVIL